MVLKFIDKNLTVEGQFRHGMAHGWIRIYQDQKLLHEGLFRMGKPLRAEKFKMEALPAKLHFSSV